MRKLFKKDKRESLSVEETFNAAYYQLHNLKRLQHLESLGIDFRGKTVLEIGAGVGDHTYYLVIKGAKVTSTDARPELVEIIKSRFGNEAFVLDVEKDLKKLESLPKFDIIYCYGLLYHVSNPSEFLKALKGKADLVLLETCVSSDHREEGPYIIDENKMDPTQASSGRGCRPSRRWIVNEMKKSFDRIYFPISQPDHAQFPKKWNAEMEDRNPLVRAIFIGSSNKLENTMLTEEMPIVYQ